MPYLGRELPPGRSGSKNIGPVEQALPFMRETLRPSHGLQNSEYEQQPVMLPKCGLLKKYLFVLVTFFKSPYRTVLKDTAIPTIFDLTSHLRHPHTRHRKRIKELVREIFTLSSKVDLSYLLFNLNPVAFQTEEDIQKIKERGCKYIL